MCARARRFASGGGGGGGGAAGMSIAAGSAEGELMPLMLTFGRAYNSLCM